MTLPTWTNSLKSHIWIFNVGRGISVFIRTALNQGIMYDVGSSEDFQPADFLKKEIIPYLDKYKECHLGQTLISHPHADHISGIACLNPQDKTNPFYASLHTCPHHKTEGPAKPEAINWDRITNPPGSENNVGLYKELYEKRSPPLQTIRYESNLSVPNLEYGLYYLRPPIIEEKIHPSNDQAYSNGISLVLYYRHGYHSILIPGDITPDALKHMLYGKEGTEKRYTVFDRSQTIKHPNWHNVSSDQPSLQALLVARSLSVLVAPHHGLESGFSEELYKVIKGNKPDLVAISEKRHTSNTDGTVDSRYQTVDGARGLKVNIGESQEQRFSVSTRDSNHILIMFQGTGGQPEIFLEKDPKKLLMKLK